MNRKKGEKSESTYDSGTVQEQITVPGCTEMLTGLVVTREVGMGGRGLGLGGHGSMRHRSRWWARKP